MDLELAAFWEEISRPWSGDWLVVLLHSWLFFGSIKVYRLFFQISTLSCTFQVPGLQQ